MKTLNNALIAVAALALLLALLRPAAVVVDQVGAAAAPPAAAPSAYTECFAAKLWSTDAEKVNTGAFPKMLRVPDGWRVVGGTTANVGTMPQAAVVLCREVSPPAPRVLPDAAPVGRCSGTDVAQMKDSGMSATAIERACNP